MTRKQTTPEEQAQALLSELIRFDKEVSNAHYEMGRILSSIEHGQLYDVLGFDSLPHLIEEKLSFAPATGRAYINVYRKFRKLKYTKAEALDCIHEYSFTNMSLYLQHATTKVSARVLKAHIARLRKRQLNFYFSNPEDYDRAVAALTKLGCTTEESGRLANSSSSLLQLVQIAEQQQRRAA